MLAKDRFPKSVIKICQLLLNNGFQAYIVGGSIRDIIRKEIEPKDWDIATDAKPSEIKEVFEEKFRVIPTGIKHGTVTILNEGITIEVTTFRIEGIYKDGRRPSEVFFVDKIEDDLSRRDLTINAIAYDPINDIICDPHNGIRDIRNNTLKMVGNPHERLKEDGLRLMRIFRFVSQLGFEIELKTYDAIPKYFKIFDKVAKERIYSELNKLIQGDYFKDAIVLLYECGLLFHIFPEFLEDQLVNELPSIRMNRIELTLEVISNLSPDSSFRLRLATLVHQLSSIPTKNRKIFPEINEKFIQEVLKGKKFSNKQISDLSQILRISTYHLPYSLDTKEDVKNYLIRKFQYRVKPQYLKDYLYFYHAREIGINENRLLSENLIKDMLERAKIHPPIDLKDLALNGDEIIHFFQIQKKFASQREFIGLCLQIVRERVEVNPRINQKQQLFSIIGNLKKVFNLCIGKISRHVRIVSTDHIRKIYRDGDPEYTSWESEHTYQLAFWVIKCLLRKDRSSIIIFDGTNFNTPSHPNHRHSMGKQFIKYHPLFIHTTVTEKEAILNLQTRKREKPTIKKSDADLEIFYRYKEIFSSFRNAFSTPNDCELLEISSRDPELPRIIENVIKNIKRNQNHLIVMSGNVLSGKTYIANILQKKIDEVRILEKF
ncbi:MAG: CCA tRNA nucleotidyltransferase [Candidatus Hodarchaeales archaeon]|jgi:tRNA nucleotidyltransferase/poly(A) polymerase